MAAERTQAQAGSGVSMVTLREASKVYDRKYRALRRVTLDVMRGEIVAVVGPPGSGKSTLLKLVNRLTEVSSGEVIVDGHSTRRWDPIALRRNLGYVVAGGGLLPQLSALDNAGLVPRLQGRPRDECRELARQHLELLGLDPRRLGTRKPAEIELADRVRVGLARALGCGEILLLDDPLKDLEPTIRRQLQEALRAILKRLGKTALWATTDLAEGRCVGDRIAQLDAGQLVSLGPAGGLGERPPEPLADPLAPQAAAAEAAPSAETPA